MSKKIIFVTAALLLAINAIAKVKVVASTSDLAYFAKEIGGDLVEVEAIASPKADLHFVDVRPSYMVKISHADLVLKVGLELDMWMDKLIDGSHNSNLKIIDCSKYVDPMEVPQEKVDASKGDLHRFGNPHYWTGPQNVAPVAEAITEGLAAVDPEHAGQFETNRDMLLAMVDGAVAGLKAGLDSLKGMNVIFYHNSWPYFASFAGLNEVGFIEPYPGVPPSPSQIKKVAELIKGHNVEVIGMEPYFDRRVPEKIARETGVRVVTLYPSIGGANSNESYRDWLAGNINRLLGDKK